MSRETRRGADLTDDVYIFDRGPGFEGVEHLKKVFTVNGQTVALDAAGIKREWDANAVVQIATDDEIAAYRREQDRFAVAWALNRLGSNIVDKGLPVPPGGVGIVVSLYLLDNADLGPWANWLSTRPRRGTAQPLIQADAEGVEINVYGPGNSGEFGPDLADAPAESVEHRVSVGAFPIVGKPCAKCGAVDALSPIELCHDCEVELALKDIAEMRAAENAPERDGWSVSDGHRPPVDDDAMKHDRHSGEG